MTMEWKSNLRRTQSLRTLPSSCDKPSWADSGRLDRKVSVSQLVSRYQTTVAVSTTIQVTAKNNEAKLNKVLKERQERGHLESEERQLESMIIRNDEKERSHFKTSLSRSKSMTSLQNGTGAIEALRARFESRSDAEPCAVRRSFRPASSVSLAQEADGEDDKRKSIGDFRDSSYVQAKDKPCVSVRAISALYLSKVAPAAGKQMAENSQQMMDGPPPSAKFQLKDSSEARAMQHSLPPHLSKGTLYQQRQKCEIRRLLKHTNPELKMLDDAVDEELAEVLSSECESTAGETGYEGEVLSRCLIFENCALGNKVFPHAPVMHMAAGTVERGNVSKTSAALEEPGERPSSNSDSNKEYEEEMNRIDVQATRRMFENQSASTVSQNPDNKQQVCINEDETAAVHKQWETCNKENLHSDNKSSKGIKRLDLTKEPHKQRPCVDVASQSNDCELSGEQYGGKEVSMGEAAIADDLPNSEGVGERIETTSCLFQNNPFISTNVERNSFVGKTVSAEDYITANVKNRAHLFNSMPFDKIRQHNNEEVETMVENINQTLNSLFRSHTIYSNGSIIEVNETMIAKKAKFILSESGPMINYNDVAEGGAQNFILQLLPRSNLKPQITYLKEDNQGRMKTTVVNVPMQQRQFANNQDTEFRTANVLQLIEDILNQDNSLRKGVIIQEDVNRCAEVIVYSLYNYAEGDVKSYIIPKGYNKETNEPDSKRDHQVTSQALPALIRPEITVKGNVKLFKSCIEKGDLEYLRSLQAESAVPEQEVSPNQTGYSTELCHEQGGQQEEGSTSEWAPVDVKRLKNIFSGDQTQIQQKQCNVATKSLNTASRGQKVLLGKGEPSAESDVMASSNEKVKSNFRECGSTELQKASPSDAERQGSSLNLDTQDINIVHQAELVEVVDENDEISNLQSVTHCLEEATMEAKVLYYSSQENIKLPSQGYSAGVLASTSTAENPRIEAELPPEKMENVSTEQMCEASIDTNITSENRNETRTPICESREFEEIHDTKGAYQQEEAKEAMESSPVTEPAQNEDEEVVFHGTVQAALDSLERSKINVTRGDFRAAMIYRNSSKSHKERSHVVDSVQQPTKDEDLPENETKSTLSQRKGVDTEAETNATLEPINHCQNPNKPAVSVKPEKRIKAFGPKPAIPPKPEHLTMKHKNNQLPNKENLETLETNKMRSETKPLPTEITQDQVSHCVHSSLIILGNEKSDISTCTGNLVQSEELKAIGEEKRPQEFPGNEDKNETDESHVDFYGACQKFGGKKTFSVKNPPVKPKRLKIAQCDSKNPEHMPKDQNSTILTHANGEPQQNLVDPSSNNPKTEIRHESQVRMREKKVKTETEDERRQRLSVHMDEIMRGNITAAMEIFDKLQKQEELQNILNRVEVIEQDTSDVDVTSLRRIFEDVPTWVVSSKEKLLKKAKAEHRVERTQLCKDNTESMSSMAHVFGDLERASEEIMTLKEQTLARLVDIEEAIKKALYSVSALKSDSDIAGLSCLFKESLGTAQGSPSSGTISKISIGSSKSITQQAHEIPTTQRDTGLPSSHDVASEKPRASPPSSPAFISIESAARKMGIAETKTCPTCKQNPKTKEKFRTSKTLKCNHEGKKKDHRKEGEKQTSHCPPDPKRELSVLQVQTDPDGKSVIGTKMITENYERTDNHGNRFYSTQTSTVVTTQPETGMSSIGQTLSSPATYQVTTYPEVQLPVNRKH
ncbi:xin actin-binding repeat-containing protein 1-like [Genypterus blacodes]|uniref:xin actin-binding repeat-containing protein 1-like n=1 Tax=Genypterus blacodes TaxID=154954 RepID=UPI003F777602